MKYSIIPEIINSKKIKFFDEKDVEVLICKLSPFKYISPFKQPYIIVDVFAKKTIRQEELVNIDITELRKLGFIITSIKSGRKGWFNHQKVIYMIENISNRYPNSKKMKEIPSNHKILKDKVNNKIKLIGQNAGYPRRGVGGPWVELTK